MAVMFLLRQMGNRHRWGRRVVWITGCIELCIDREASWQAQSSTSNGSVAGYGGSTGGGAHNSARSRLPKSRVLAYVVGQVALSSVPAYVAKVLQSARRVLTGADKLAQVERALPGFFFLNWVYIFGVH
jgi:hypothetical protein